MTHRILTLSCILAALAVTVPAAAAAQRGDGYGTARVRTLASRYADCVVARFTPQAMDVVVNNIPNNEILSRFRRLDSINCMSRVSDSEGGGIRFGGDTFRYMLADGLVRLHYGNAGPSDFAAVPPLAFAPVPPLDEAALSQMGEQQQAEQRDRHRMQMASRAVAILGDCAARAQPESVRRIALTEPASPEEGEALLALRPTLGACLPADSSVRLSREILRGTLLFGYYRLAHTAQPPQPIGPEAQ